MGVSLVFCESLFASNIRDRAGLRSIEICSEAGARSDVAGNPAFSALHQIAGQAETYWRLGDVPIGNLQITPTRGEGFGEMDGEIGLGRRFSD